VLKNATARSSFHFSLYISLNLKLIGLVVRRKPVLFVQSLLIFLMTPTLKNLLTIWGGVTSTQVDQAVGGSRTPGWQIGCLERRHS